MAEAGLITLYRAMSAAEFAQVMRKGFVPDVFGHAGKFFAEHLEHAERWAHS